MLRYRCQSIAVCAECRLKGWSSCLGRGWRKGRSQDKERLAEEATRKIMTRYGEQENLDDNNDKNMTFTIPRRLFGIQRKSTKSIHSQLGGRAAAALTSMIPPVDMGLLHCHEP